MIPSILPLDPPLKVYMCGEMDWLKNGMTYVVLPSSETSRSWYTVHSSYYVLVYGLRTFGSPPTVGCDQVTDGEGRVDRSWYDVMARSRLPSAEFA